MTWKAKVRKRLGKIEAFDRERIASSIFKAVQRVGGKDRKLAEALAKKVEDYLEEKFLKRKIIPTDEIGNAVEKILIEEGHAKTAKAFILYREGQGRTRKKLIKFKDLPKLHQFLKLTDRKIVFTSGVFDLFHIGHARYLKKASLQGNVLVVGLNGDESASGLKGEERPILGEEARAEMLSFLEFIDFIVMFSEPTAASIISKLKPDIYVCVEGSWKGDLEEKPEVKEARKYGSKIAVFPPQSLEISTSVIIDKIKNKKEEFQNVQLVVSAFIMKGDKILLVKQKNHDFWSPPGGLVEPFETFEQACCREIKEELGLEISCGNFIAPVMFWDKKTQERVLVLYYIAQKKGGGSINIDTKINQRDRGGVEKYQWLDLARLESVRLAPSVLPAVNKLKERLEKDLSAGKIGRLNLKNKTRGKMGKAFYPYLPPGREIKFAAEDNPFMYRAKMISQKSGCAKQPTGAVVVKNGKIIGKGTNAGQKVDSCPRVKKRSKTGQDYYLCKEVCYQEGHAEVMAARDAKQKGLNTNGADLYLYGHWWCCKDCWDEMIKAKIKDVYLVADAYGKFNFINT